MRLDRIKDDDISIKRMMFRLKEGAAAEIRMTAVNF